MNRGRALLPFCLTLGLIAPVWIGAVSAPQTIAASRAEVSAVLRLPRLEGSVRFAVLGDSGTGERAQYELAAQMAAFHTDFPFDFVIMPGDNIIGSDTPADMERKFSLPYKALLDKGVKFHAVLGNHDNPNQRFYKPFNMGGESYFTFLATGKGPFEPKGGSVRFFGLLTGYLDKPQVDWLETEFASSSSPWSIAFFHHPLYSSGRAHGPSLETRAILEPLFVKHGLSAAFSGHDHVYERIKPQKGGIGYWVSGAGGRLRKGGLRSPSSLTAKGFDQDCHFMIVEITGEEMHFQAISRTGASVDSGVFRLPKTTPAEAATNRR